MVLEVIRCPNCGAPLPAEAAGAVVTCAYCKVAVTGIPGAAWGTGSVLDTGSGDPADARLPRAWVGDHRYVVLGRLARGEGCDVFLARRDARLTEMVVLKVVRALADADLLAREWTVLEALHQSTAQGYEHFTQLLPQPVCHGKLSRDGRDPRPASVYRWRSGFQHTFEDIRAAYPQGVDPRAAVWIWRRTLESLGWVHRAGWVHGAVLPAHLLVHPRDHGVVLVGWSRAVKTVGLGQGREGLPATTDAARAYYPRAVWDGAAPARGDDLAMAARCVAYLLGGDPATGTVPQAVPAPLATLVRAYADGDGRRDIRDDAWAAGERVAAAAREAYGPPRFQPFALPGWR